MQLAQAAANLRGDGTLMQADLDAVVTCVGVLPKVHEAVLPGTQTRASPGGRAERPVPSRNWFGCRFWLGAHR